MAYQLHHIHIKSPDPRKTAQWYVENFGARIASERTVNGALFIGVDLSGVLVNISAPAPGQKLPKGSADMHLGLEHFGLVSPDLEKDLARLKAKGVEILQPLTEGAGGAKIAFIKAPDDVRIELLQLPSS